MSTQSLAHVDRDMEGVDAALRRAARRARELGEQTGTPVYVLRDGKIVDLTAETLSNRGPEKEEIHQALKAERDSP